VPDADPTRLCVIVASNTDADRLMRALVADGFIATKIASSGGFLRRGNTTILTGVAESAVDQLMELVRQECHARTEIMSVDALPFDPAAGVGTPVEVRVGGAIAFVLDVARFERV
jgi:uncharacterized protein YaaQ